MILLWQGSLEALSQSDSVCYSSAENRLIAHKLIEGKKCEFSLHYMQESYDDCTEQLKIQSEEMAITNSLNIDLKGKIEEKDQLIERLENKIKRRNRVITVMAVAEALTAFFLLVTN